MAKFLKMVKQLLTSSQLLNRGFPPFFIKSAQYPSTHPAFSRMGRRRSPPRSLPRYVSFSVFVLTPPLPFFMPVADNREYVNLRPQKWACLLADSKGGGCLSTDLRTCSREADGSRNFVRYILRDKRNHQPLYSCSDPTRISPRYPSMLDTICTPDSTRHFMIKKIKRTVNMTLSPLAKFA